MAVVQMMSYFVQHMHRVTYFGKLNSDKFHKPIEFYLEIYILIQPGPKKTRDARGLVALFIYKLQQIYSRFRKLRIQLKDHNESFIFHEKKIQIALLLLCCILSSFVGISFLEFVNFKRKQRHVVQGLSLAMLLGKKIINILESSVTNHL